MKVHSAKQAWNLKRGGLQITVFSKGLLFRIHLDLGECRASGFHKTGLQRGGQAWPLLPGLVFGKSWLASLYYMWYHIHKYIYTNLYTCIYVYIYTHIEEPRDLSYHG